MYLPAGFAVYEPIDGEGTALWMRVRCAGIVDVCTVFLFCEHSPPSHPMLASVKFITII